MSVIEDKRKNSVIVYRTCTCDEVTVDCSSFYLKDLVEYISDFFPDELKSKEPIILDLLSIYVDKDFRGSNIGSSHIKELCENNKDKYIILISGALDKEYGEDYVGDEALDKILANLDHFYLKNGFINVNDKIGMYEENITYIYLNETSSKLLKTLGYISKEDEVKYFNSTKEE